VFQSDLLYDLVFALKCFYPLVHKHGLHDGFQHVIMINLMRLTDFISFRILEHKIKRIQALPLDWNI